MHLKHISIRRVISIHQVCFFINYTYFITRDLLPQPHLNHIWFFLGKYMQKRLTPKYLCEIFHRALHQQCWSHIFNGYLRNIYISCNIYEKNNSKQKINSPLALVPLWFKPDWYSTPPLLFSMWVRSSVL